MRLSLWTVVWERGVECQLSCSPASPSFPPCHLLLRLGVVVLALPALPSNAGSPVGGLQVGKAPLVSSLRDLKDDTTWG